MELRDRRTKEVLKFAPEFMVAEVQAARERILAELQEAGGR